MPWIKAAKSIDVPIGSGKLVMVDNVTNGKLLCGPGVRDVKSDAVKTKDNDVSIEVP